MNAKWVLGVVASAAFAAPAEAGSGRCCRPCGQGMTYSQGGWYHFRSATVGSYVPYAPPTVTAAVPAAPTVPMPAAPVVSGAQPPMAQGNGVVRRFSYEPGAAPAGTVSGLSETPTFAASPPSEPPRYNLPRREARYEGQYGNPHVGETVFRRLNPGHGWRP